MAVDKRGRKLPKGIRQRYNDFEGRFMYQGERYLVHGKTVTETQKAMTELKYRLEHGLFVERKKITLNEWFDTWMEEYKNNQVKVGTCINYREYYKNNIKDVLGNKVLTDIRPEHIQKLYNDMVKAGYAVSSIKVVSSSLSGCLQQAYKNRLIEQNPCRLCTLPREKERKVKQAMTKEQQDLFMKYAEDSYLYNYFYILLRTGIRSGEARGLKASDIDKKGKVLHIVRNLRYVNGKGYIEDTPKTVTSRRDIPLTNDMIRALDNQKGFWGFKVEKIDRYLFCTEKGEVLKQCRVQGEINRITDRIRCDGKEFPHITPHTFRHTFATRAIEAGMQPQVLKTILGHSSLAMTMDLYSHVLPDTKAQEMEKIANIF